MTRHICAGPAGRREFLRAGTLALGGLSLLRLLEAREQSGLAADTSVILFWMWGGPSQLETFDPNHEFLDFGGRPQRILYQGEAIQELIS